MAIHLDECVYSISGFSLVFSKAIASIPFGFWLIDAVELKKIVRTFLLWITELFLKTLMLVELTMFLWRAQSCMLHRLFLSLIANYHLANHELTIFSRRFACGPHNNQFIDSVVVLVR